MIRQAIVVYLFLGAATCISGQAYSVLDIQGLRIQHLDLKGYEKEQEMRSLGEYYVAYRGTGIHFKDGLGVDQEVVDYAYIYVEKSRKVSILAKLTKTKVYNALGKVIKEFDKKNPFYSSIIGLSPEILIDPLGIGVVIKTSTGFRETESYCLLEINISNVSAQEHILKLE